MDVVQCKFIFVFDTLACYNILLSLALTTCCVLSFYLAMSANLFRASVFLCAFAVGVKLPPLIIFPGTEGGPVHAEFEALLAQRNDCEVLMVQ